MSKAKQEGYGLGITSYGLEGDGYAIENNGHITVKTGGRKGEDYVLKSYGWAVEINDKFELGDIFQVRKSARNERRLLVEDGFYAPKDIHVRKVEIQVTPIKGR